jgi:hypothetical protein
MVDPRALPDAAPPSSSRARRGYITRPLDGLLADLCLAGELPAIVDKSFTDAPSPEVAPPSMDALEQEAREYFFRLGVPRYRWMEAMSPSAEGPEMESVVESAVESPEVAADVLGLSRSAFRRVVNEATADELAATWGLSRGVDPNVVLRDVRELCRRAQLSTADVVALVHSQYVNPGLELATVAVDGAAALRLEGGSAAVFRTFLDRIPRFCELLRGTGWSAAELDEAIGRIGGGLSLQSVLLLAEWVRLRGELGVSPSEIASWRKALSDPDPARQSSVWAAIASVLRLTPGELDALQIISGLTAFDVSDIRATRRFVELVSRVRASGFTVAELDFLVRDADLGAPDLPTLSAEQDLDSALSMAFGLSVEVTRFLLDTLRSRADVGVSARADLRSSSAAVVLGALRRLQKVAMVASRLNLSVAELTWISSKSLINLDAFSSEEANPSGQPLFDALLRLFDFVRLRGAFKSVPTFVDLLNQGSLVERLASAGYWKTLAEQLSAPLDDVRCLADGLDIAPKGAPSGPIGDRELLRLGDALALLRRLGLSAAVAVPWAFEDAMDSSAALAELQKRVLVLKGALRSS